MAYKMNLEQFMVTENKEHLVMIESIKKKDKKFADRQESTWRSSSWPKLKQLEPQNKQNNT